MPVPKSRTDLASFSPLWKLQLRETLLLLCPIHEDDKEGTTEETGAAGKAWEIAVRCNSERMRDGENVKEDAGSIIAISNSVCVVP